MTRQTKRDRERAQLDFMIEKLGLDVVRVTPGEPPAPDFLLELRDGAKIAVELTEARESYIAEGTGALKRLRSAVLKLLGTRGVTAAVRAHLRLREETAAFLNSDAKLLHRVAEQVVAFVEPHVQQVAAGPSRPFTEEDLRAAGVECLRGLLLQPFAKLDVSTGTIGPGQRSTTIQAAIDRKASKLENYRAEVAGAATWLLIVGGAGRGASVDAWEADGTFVSPFDRTIFVELYEGKCVVLTTTKPTDGGT